MQAVEYVKPGTLNLKTLPEPEPSPDEVCVQVAFAGICGTDLHIIKGEAPAAERVVLGHEFSGIVRSVGSAVRHISVNDAVAVDPNNYCGHCEPCRKGQVHFCRHISPVGIYRNGAWAEYCVVPAEQVYPLRSKDDLIHGALAEPLSCILHGWDRLQPLHQEQSVCILGAGLIGLLWALLLRGKGFSRIILSEISTHRLERARRIGFSTASPESVSAGTANGNRFDAVIDCSGNPGAIETAADWLNPMGRLLLFGICPEDTTIRINPFRVFQKELTILGSVINPFTFARALEALDTITVSMEDLGVAFYPLEQFREAIDAAESGRFTKVIFKVMPSL